MTCARSRPSSTRTSPPVRARRRSRRWRGAARWARRWRAPASGSRRAAWSPPEEHAGAIAAGRQEMERRLAYLGTLGNNAPFVGLFRTVIGVILAFEELGRAGGAARTVRSPPPAS